MFQPLISICIPAYNRADKLRRLLESIAIQKFKSYEVIVSDDSNTDVVKKLVDEYKGQFSIIYKQNINAFGTPENWNESVRIASGKWIKIMHDDDWFSFDNSLEQFAKAVSGRTDFFVFSAYNNVNVGEIKTAIYISPKKLKRIQKYPVNLWARNLIGPPSVILYPNDGKYIYDSRMKWLVDIDMYIRRITHSKVVYISQPLVNVELSDTQVTAYVKNDPKIEIPEHFLLIKKLGLPVVKNILIYDYHWRFIRNFRIKKFEQFYNYGYEGDIIPLYVSMIKWQSLMPNKILRLGVASKILMFLNYLVNYNKIQ